MPIPTNKEEWEDLATRALRAFLEHRGAVVRAEAEAHLCELGWVTTNLDNTIPTYRGPQPHHITTARRRLIEDGVLDEQTVMLNERPVTAWLNGLASLSKQETEVQRTAARKRRLYRTYLSWTGNPSLCGHVAERVVEASLLSLTGKNLWIPDSAERGQVRELQGRAIEVGGPLDAAGEWAVNPDRLSDGTVPFAIEVKNIRSWIYPWDAEAWDLLAKLAAFPDVLPILVARRIHPITFRAFKDLGALGVGVETHWFSDSVDKDRFNRVVDEFGFFDAVRIPPRQAKPLSRVVGFFNRVAYTDSDGQTLMQDQLTKWERAAVIAQDYATLRDDKLHPGDRAAYFEEFCERVIDAGLYQRGEWAPWHLTV